MRHATLVPQSRPRVVRVGERQCELMFSLEGPEACVCGSWWSGRRLMGMLGSAPRRVRACDAFTASLAHRVDWIRALVPLSPLNLRLDSSLSRGRFSSQSGPFEETIGAAERRLEPGRPEVRISQREMARLKTEGKRLA